MSRAPTELCASFACEALSSSIPSPDLLFRPHQASPAPRPPLPALPPLVAPPCRAATQLHGEMAERVVRAPLSFFHTQPTGRILNRFSKDQGTVDEQLAQVFFDW